jgi:hypothetical protein
MQLNFRQYQISKTRKYLIKNNFLILSIGSNQNSQNWLQIEQGLKKLKLNYHKLYNNITKKTIKNSIFKNSLNMINSTFFFLKPNFNKANNFLIKPSIINNLKSIFFTVLSIKLNNQIYSISQFKNIKSLTYKNNMAIMYQFLLTHLKFSYRLNSKKFSKQCDLNT